MKQITTTLYDGSEEAFNVATASLTRYKDTNLVNALTINLEDEAYILVKAFGGKINIILFKRSEGKAFRGRLMQHDVKTLSYDDKTLNSAASTVSLNEFAKAFTIHSDIQKALVKANAVLSKEDEQVLLSKSAQLMIPSFMQQLTAKGISYKSFDVETMKKLSAALIDFVQSTGNIQKQKTIFQNFIQLLK